MQPENLRTLLTRKVLDTLPKVRNLRPIRHLIPREHLHPLVKHARLEVLLRIRVHQKLIKVVCNTSSVLNRRNHVPHSRPRGLRSFLRVHFNQMVLQKLRASGEIRLVELIRHVPSNRTELSPLLHNRVQEAHHEQQLPPLVPLHDVQHILCHPRVAIPQPSLHPHRRLIRYFDPHLQESNREHRVGLRGDPQPKFLVNLLRFHEELLHLL
mmetsp:Transcript_10938/g.12897  ORF Transcript_10938/g.12897 Transcript_10938/m.12897 type:complete len:211 (+) Transcript_10938:529-1161(+)